MNLEAKNQTFYEAKKFGVTVEFDKNFQAVNSAYAETSSNGACLYQINPDGTKILLKSK